MSDVVAASSSRRRVWVRLFVSLLFASGLAWILLRGGLPIVPPAAELSRVRPGAVLAYVGILAFAITVRSLRWRHVVPEMPTAQVTGIGLIGAAAIFVAPLRLGEAVRPLLFASAGRVPLARTLALVVAERVLDGLVLSVMFFAALSASSIRSPLPDHLGDLPLPVAAVPPTASAAVAVFGVAGVVLVALAALGDRGPKLVAAVVSPVSARLGARAEAFAERGTLGLRSLGTRQALPFFGETLVYWGATVVAMKVLANGLGLPLGVAEAAVTMGVLGVGIIVPSGPGFFGAFQLSTYVGLALYFPMEQVVGDGALYVFVMYSAQIAVALLAALAGWALGALRAAPEELDR